MSTSVKIVEPKETASDKSKAESKIDQQHKTPQQDQPKKSNPLNCLTRKRDN